jgi:hypothetical protein
MVWVTLWITAGACITGALGALANPRDPDDGTWDVYTGP